LIVLTNVRLRGVNSVVALLGDLEATTADGAKIELFNVIFVSRKVHTVEELIAVMPDQVV
jgi:hypothetical protein